MFHVTGIVFRKEYNLVYLLHYASLVSDSTLVKKFQIGFTDILAFKLFPSFTFYLVYVSNRLTDFSQRKSTRYSAANAAYLKPDATEQGSKMEGLYGDRSGSPSELVSRDINAAASASRAAYLKLNATKKCRRGRA